MYGYAICKKIINNPVCGKDFIISFEDANHSFKNSLVLITIFRML